MDDRRAGVTPLVAFVVEPAGVEDTDVGAPLLVAVEVVADQQADRAEQRHDVLAVGDRGRVGLRGLQVALGAGDLLGGALTLTHRRCGKAGCHCASGNLHPMWTLTYSVEGSRCVEVIPHDQVEKLKLLVERYREHRDALYELGAINAQLLRLWRQEQRNRKNSVKTTCKTKTARHKPRRRQR